MNVQSVFDRAVSALNAGSVLEAEKLFREVLRVDKGSVPSLNLLAITLMRQKRFAEAEPFFVEAIRLGSRSTATHHNYGVLLQAVGQFAVAVEQFGAALNLQQSADDHVKRADCLWYLRRSAEAAVDYRAALSIDANLPEAWLGLGLCQTQMAQHGAAAASYGRAAALNPDLPGIRGATLHAKMRCCDWADFDTMRDACIAGVRDGKPDIDAYTFLTISQSSSDQLQCASTWLASKPDFKRRWQWVSRGGKIRIGYLSSDFRDHPVSNLLAGVFEAHDRSRFDVVGFSVGPDDGSAMRQRIRASLDFVDVAGLLSAEQIAAKISTAQLDILVDLNGLTGGDRIDVLQCRAAPIQVNYLGYPGTVPAPYVDYIIADSVVIPEGEERFYTEKVLRLPHCYQANDRARPIATQTPSRAESGLPAGAFVFCCFNVPHKITPQVFGCWMNILRDVPDAVLWLIDNNEAAANLRKEAQKHGIDPARLVFAKRVPLPDHLARHRLADLFLDTLPYGAHTTASDALWAGLPVLTQLGTTFAGRVGASLLHAIGLPELITTTAQDYQRMAVDLARDRQRLAAIKAKLATNRLTTPLFDTAAFTADLERLYLEICEKQEKKKVLQ